MKLYGQANLSAIMGDRVLYRNLIPVDRSLPGLPQLRSQMGIAENHIPRKASLEYAHVVTAILKTAQRDRTATPLSRMMLIGDTHMNDGSAFANIAAVSGWRGLGFIGVEKNGPETFEPQKKGDSIYYHANRWSALERFDQVRLKQAFPVDEGTVILIDIDKTAIGARGRNDALVDRARLTAACATAREAFGESINLDRFQSDYQTLNQPEFHPVTADNQDFLVYICMMVNLGPFDLNQLLTWIQSEKISSFNDFLREIESRLPTLPKAHQALHADFITYHAIGDPTPFKAFRHREFFATVSLMGSSSPQASPEEHLKNEIVITGEVYHYAMQWASQGALVFGASDKPDEATLPTPEQAAAGLRPIHQTETHIIGA